MFDITFIGYGIATMCALLALPSHIKKIAVIDPYGGGGSLLRHYATVHSNTTWGQFIDAITPFTAPAKLRALRDKHSLEATTTLGELIRSLKSIIPVNEVYRIVATAKEAHFKDGSWNINLDNKSSIKTNKLILCTGAQPLTLNYPIPQLPLENVLNAATLSAVARPLDTIVIVGASHSGTLAAARASEAGLNVSLVYRGDGPAFKYARDGHYDGIKQESAQIADKIMTGEMPNVRVLSAEDDVRNALLTADWITYACGFEPTKTIRLFVDGAEVNAEAYDAVTGALTEAPQAWGFGIAYPNSNVVGSATYYDVSIPAFLAHISRNLSAISR